jgi:hypothetical protein
MKQFNIFPVGLVVLALWSAGCSDGSSNGVSGLNEVPSGTSTGGAASMEATSGGTAQAGIAGGTVAAAPAVVVKNSAGAVLPGVMVTFAVTAGNGSVANATAVTNAMGVASAGAWTLGAMGTNSVEARVGSLTVRFYATAESPVPVSAYSITVRYLATPSARQQQAVTNAVARWQSVITRDLVDIPVNASANACWDGQPAFNERIDDILIFVELVEIDGAGKILGEAGPCFVRSDNNLPVVGHLKLDAADLRQMEANGTIDDVVLHEIGHVLGIGTMWGEKGLLQGKGGADPMFLGANAVSSYRTIGGTAAGVPVENIGGEGTRDGHWRESTFGNELMTGWVNSGSNPLSAMTIASLNDMGYGANAGAASSYALGGTSGRSTQGGVEIGKHEMLKSPKYKVDKAGRKEKLEL